VAELHLGVAAEDDVTVARCDKVRPWPVGESAASEGWLLAASAWRWWRLGPTQRGGEEQERRRHGGGYDKEQGKRSGGLASYTGGRLGFLSRWTVDGLGVGTRSHVAIIQRWSRDAGSVGTLGSFEKGAYVWLRPCGSA
jgi:hypothetical protein